jgi:hypothetical protein
MKGWILFDLGRIAEAIAEQDRALTLDPADVDTMQALGWDYVPIG